MVSKNLSLEGLITYWSLTEHFNRAKLKAGWDAAGFDYAVPEPKANITVLKDALNQVFNKRYLVRPLSARTGFTVVHESRGADDNQYASMLTAKVFGDAEPVITTAEPDKKDEVLAVYRQGVGRINSYQVASSLTKILNRLGGTRLRPSGGVYWLHGAQKAAWEAATAVVEQAATDGAATVYMIQHELNSKSILAVRDGLISEVESEVSQIKKDIFENDLGERALRSRREEAAEMKKKVEKYENMLGVAMEALKKSLDDIALAGAMADMALAAPAEPQPAPEGNHLAMRV